RGNYSLTLRAEDDGDGGGRAEVRSATYTFVFTVSSPNDPPVLSAIRDAVAVVGQPFSLPIRASDLDQEPLTFTLTGLPTQAGLTAGTAYGTQTLNWTPADGQTGTYTVTVTVTDGGAGTPANALSDSKTFHLVVRTADQAPAVTPVADQTTAEAAT